MPTKAKVIRCPRDGIIGILLPLNICTEHQSSTREYVPLTTEYIVHLVNWNLKNGRAPWYCSLYLNQRCLNVAFQLNNLIIKCGMW